MSQRHLLALFNSFDEAEAAIAELRAADIKGFNIDDLVLESPIEHPEVAALLGDKPVYVQWYTLAGSILGGLLGFFLIASAQANFFAQMKGGQPIVPLPPQLRADLLAVHSGWHLDHRAGLPDRRRLAGKTLAAIQRQGVARPD